MRKIILLIIFTIVPLCLSAQVIWSTGSPYGIVPIYMAKYEQSGEPDELPLIAYTPWGSSGAEGMNVYNPYGLIVTPEYIDLGSYTLTMSNVPGYLTGSVLALISTPTHFANFYSTGSVIRDSTIVVSIDYPADYINGFDLILYILKP